jgi:hypothetical protein
MMGYALDHWRLKPATRSWRFPECYTFKRTPTMKMASKASRYLATLTDN